MTTDFKPMLASPVDFKHLKFQGNDVYGSPKLDGIRAVVYRGQLVSRSLKPIRNRYLQEVLAHPALEGLDGELVVGDPTDPLCYTNTNSAVMSASGEPSVRFYLFDYFAKPHLPYFATLSEDRWGHLSRAADRAPSHIKDLLIPLDQVLLIDRDSVDKFEASLLEDGHEGAMLRYGRSPYKFGRSTAKEGHLLKLKRMASSEARIIGFECLYSNQNAAKTNALGHTERSTSKEGLVPQDTLGVLEVRDVETGVVFGIGTGFTAEQRKHIWDNQKNYLGKVCTYHHFEVGAKDKPRFPSFKGIRDPIDMI